MKALFLSVFILLGFALKASVLTINLYPTNATCNNPNGTVSVSVTGGTPPFSVLWSNGSTQVNNTGLLPGVYTVYVTDAIGTLDSATTTVFSTPNLTNADMTFIVPGQGPPGFDVTLPCNNQCNGIAYLTESSIIGMPPYMISIIASSNPNLVPTVVGGVNAVTNICISDNYQVQVSDNSGCSTIIYVGPPDIPRSFDHQAQINGACFGQNNGSAVLDFSNLYTQDLNINYSGPVNGSLAANNPVTISNLLPGSYIFNVAYPTIASCDTTIMLVIPDLGINCGLISGSVFLDTISNCMADAGEPLLPQQIIRFDPGPYFVTSDSAGNFNAGLPYNTYTATLVAAPPLYSVCNSVGLNLSALNDTINNVMLGDSVTTGTAIRVGIINSAFRPGFTGTLYANVSNNSYYKVMNPQLEIFYDTVLTFQNSTLTPIINIPGHLSFSLDSINPFSNSSLPIYFQVPPNPNLIGTNFLFIANVNANVPEADTTDNTDSLVVQVTGSYDPNDKAVLPSRGPLNTFFTDIDEEFEYQIRFQNSGTDTAFTVIVIDTLSSALDPSSISIIACSHPMQWDLSGTNVLKFRFNNILLPDSIINEAASHGAVSFKIKPYLPVSVSTIENRAGIYFDFNPAIFTNVISSFITVSVGVNVISRVNDLTLIPNPASGILNILLNKSLFQPETITVTNLMGQILLQTSANFSSGELKLDVSKLLDGIYFLNLSNSKGESVSARLVIKQG